MGSPNDGAATPSGEDTAAIALTPRLLSEIHARFRREMNADTAAALQRHGVTYHICFGVPSMRLKAIARDYAPSAALAEALWAEDIREARMMATRLFPPEEMTPTVAHRWATETRYEEIADQACMNLFVRLPFAPTLMTEWMKANAEQSPMTLYCGLKLATRIPRSQWPQEAIDAMPKITADIITHATRMSLRTAAYWLANTHE